MQNKMTIRKEVFNGVSHLAATGTNATGKICSLIKYVCSIGKSIKIVLPTEDVPKF